MITTIQIQDIINKTVQLAIQIESNKGSINTKSGIEKKKLLAQQLKNYSKICKYAVTIKALPVYQKIYFKTLGDNIEFNEHENTVREIVELCLDMNYLVLGINTRMEKLNYIKQNINFTKNMTDEVDKEINDCLSQYKNIEGNVNLDLDQIVQRQTELQQYNKETTRNYAELISNSNQIAMSLAKNFNNLNI